MGHEQLMWRIKSLNETSTEGSHVLCVMSRDQRVRDNHALLAAQHHALAKQIPLVVVFCLYDTSGYRTREHYDFMLRGLREVEKDLAQKHIAFSLLVGTPKDMLVNYIKEAHPDAVYFDFSSLQGPRKLQSSLVAGGLDVSMYVVDTHNIIPCWIASDKKEFSAATFRPKVYKKIGAYLEEPDEVVKHPYRWEGKVESFAEKEADIHTLLENLPHNNVQHSWDSGEAAVLEHLRHFIDTKLEAYADLRNHPSEDALSDLSPYLHFGQISSLRVALELQKIVDAEGAILHLLQSNKMPKAENFSNKKLASVAALLEEMIVRKELADNFCYYETHYKSLDGAADWARETIAIHDDDKREHLYSIEHLERAKTHDQAWNAAQRQLTRTGKMHGYMRMYWAKKVKEWTPDGQTALDVLVELNDRYSLDGRDPNGYVGIMWSVCGVHDRPWAERDIFGKIRYMNYAGLKRKFDIAAYEKLYSSN